MSSPTVLMFLGAISHRADFLNRTLEKVLNSSHKHGRLKTGRNASCLTDLIFRERSNGRSTFWEESPIKEGYHVGHQPKDR